MRSCVPSGQVQRRSKVSCRLTAIPRHRHPTRGLPSRRGCCHPSHSQTRTNGFPASGSSRVSFWLAAADVARRVGPLAAGIRGQDQAQVGGVVAEQLLRGEDLFGKPYNSLFRKKKSLFLSEFSLIFRVEDFSANPSKCRTFWSICVCHKAKYRTFPVLFPVSREVGLGDGFRSTASATTQSQGSSSVSPSRTYCAGMAAFPHPFESLHSVSVGKDAAFWAPSLQRKIPFPAPGGDRFDD